MQTQMKDNTNKHIFTKTFKILNHFADLFESLDNVEMLSCCKCLHLNQLCKFNSSFFFFFYIYFFFIYMFLVLFVKC